MPGHRGFISGSDAKGPVQLGDRPVVYVGHRSAGRRPGVLLKGSAYGRAVDTDTRNKNEALGLFAHDRFYGMYTIIAHKKLI